MNEASARVERKVQKGESVIISANEFDKLTCRHKHLVNIVLEPTPNGVMALKPITDSYESGPPRMLKLGYVEIQESDSESELFAYSRDELIDEIQRVSKIVERAPTTTDIEKHANMSMSPYRRVFGGIEGALKAADLYPTLEDSSNGGFEEDG